MNSPQSPIQAAVTRARIERVIARLPGLSEERLEGIEATLFEFGELRQTCHRCGQGYPPVSRALPDLPASVSPLHRRQRNIGLTCDRRFCSSSASVRRGVWRPLPASAC